MQIEADLQSTADILTDAVQCMTQYGTTLRTDIKKNGKTFLQRDGLFIFIQPFKVLHSQGDSAKYDL